MSQEEEYVSVYGPPELEVWCLDGDRLRAAGLGSGQCVGEALIKRGLGGIVERVRNQTRMNRLFKEAKAEGAALDDYFLFTPHLWTALMWMAMTRGAGDIDRGAIALTLGKWMDLLDYYLDSGREEQPPKEEREEVVRKARECFQSAAEVFYDDPAADDVLTFFIRWA